MTSAAGAIRHVSCTTCHAIFRGGRWCPEHGAPLEPRDDDPLVGLTIDDRYVIESVIGEGGVGRVYAARHRRMSRRFAIKVPFGELAYDPKMRRRFLREADAAGRLSHRNVVGVVDVGETEQGLVYMALELVDGVTLRDLLERTGPLPRARVVDLARQLADGLAHAHDRGLIHRDLKPDNVVVDASDTARIIDFGIAIPGDLEELGRLTTEGIIVGTPYYMAPEQATGGQVDIRTDLFSFGLILYEMLAGVPPFVGSPIEVIQRHIDERPPRVAERVPGLVVDEDLERLAFWLLEKDPAGRPVSAHVVVERLRAIAQAGPPRARRGLPTEAVPTTALPVPARRRRWPLTVPIALAVAVAIGGWRACVDDPGVRDARSPPADRR